MARVEPDVATKELWKDKDSQVVKNLNALLSSGKDQKNSRDFTRQREERGDVFNHPNTRMKLD